jgi:hypothetical protein
MNYLEALRDGNIVSISDGYPNAEAIMTLHNHPKCACDCCGGVGVHVMELRLGPLILRREINCRGCDEDGLMFYACRN